MAKSHSVWRRLSAAVALSAGLAAPSVDAAPITATWQGGSSGSWIEGSNWNFSSPPARADYPDNSGGDTFDVRVLSGRADLPLNAGVITEKPPRVTDISSLETVRFATVGVSAGNRLRITDGTHINNGSVSVTKHGLSGATPRLEYTEDTAISGTGAISLGGGELRVTNADLTNPSGHRIYSIGDGGEINLFGSSTLINNGTVSSKYGDTLNIVGGNIYNRGLITTDHDGSKVNITSSFIANTNSIIQADGNGSEVIIGGQNTTRVSGGTLRGINGGLLRLRSGTTFFSATSNGVAVTLDGEVSQMNGDTVAIADRIVNNGTWRLNSTGSTTSVEIVESKASIEGAGELVLGSSLESRNQIVVPSRFVNGQSFRFTNADGHTIRGGGDILHNVGGFTNAGNLIQQGDRRLQIDPGAGGFLNTGLMRAEGDGGLVFVSTGRDFTNSGTFEVAATSTATLTGGDFRQTGGVTTLDGVFQMAPNEGFLLDGGLLRIGANERLTDSLALTVNGGTFDLQGFNQTIGSLSGNGGVVNLGSGGRLTLDDDGEGSNYAGIISGQGTVVYNGDQGITLLGKSTFTGTLDVQRGTVALINGGNLADGLNVTLSSISSKLLLGSNVEDTIGSLSGRGQIQLGPDSTLTVGGFGPGVPVRTVFSGHMFGEGGFTQTGFKLIQMTGQNTYTGDTTLDNGHIQISNNDVIADSSDVVIKGGSLRLSRGFTDTVGSLSGNSGNVYVEDGAELSVGANNTSTTYSGSVRGDGALVKTGSGTMTLDGGGTLSVDELTVAGGQVRLNGTGALEMSSIKVNSGTSLNLLGRTRVDRVSAALVNDGFVFARLSGTIFDGDVSGGGDFGGRTIFNGSYGPGNSPALVSHQTTQFTSNNTLYMELGGLNRGSQYDAIDANIMTLGGMLSVNLIDLLGGSNPYAPSSGDFFDLFAATTISGMFSAFDFSGAMLTAGLDWSWDVMNLNGLDTFRLMVTGSVLSDSVPTPGALLLFGFGLLLLGMRHRIG